MFKKVLVPVDGSDLSEEVLPVVAELLAGTTADVTLFIAGEEPQATRRRRPGLRQALPLGGIAAPGGISPGVLPAAPPAYAESKGQAIARREDELLGYLDNVGKVLLKTGRPVHAAVHFGNPAAEIVAFAKKERFDLIAMATHGRSGLSETLHGSVTAEVVRSGVAPVLVVRPKRKQRKKRA
ncbi:MAG: universal stress protein [Dehalococcoidia bacterium]